MIRARSAGTRTLLAGLAVAAVAAGSASAAMPTPRLRLHARLAPVAGTTAPGRFDGVLTRSGGGLRSSPLPRNGLRWQLAWGLSLPALHGPVSAFLRIKGGGGAARIVRPLCVDCGAGSDGSVGLTSTQVLRMARYGGVVTVRAGSARLRGTVRVLFVARPG
jgi:hypothetical protein